MRNAKPIQTANAEPAFFVLRDDLDPELGVLNPADRIRGLSFLPITLSLRFV